MKNCKKPTCVYSETKDKCIKPNPYTQYISYCKKLGKTFSKCKDEYNKNNS